MNFYCTLTVQIWATFQWFSIIFSWSEKNIKKFNIMWRLRLAKDPGDISPNDPLQWRHNRRDSVSNHQPHDCLLNCLFRRRWKKTSKLRVTGLCVGNSRVTGEYPAQMANNAENVSIWWRHYAIWCFHIRLRVFEPISTLNDINIIISLVR